MSSNMQHDWVAFPILPMLLAPSSKGVVAAALALALPKPDFVRGFEVSKGKRAARRIAV